MLVGASQFTSAMNAGLSKLSLEAEEQQHVVAYYAEREVRKTKGSAQVFFPGSESGRATGGGVQPVIVDPKKQDVGSEGILAALITKFCSSHPKASVSHPGPDALRSKMARKIVIVTDFIGSGLRLSSMLDSFAKVASIQSWKSYHLLTYHVVCYSGTEAGLKVVSRHSLRPEIITHIACPVIDEVFDGAELGVVKNLCRRYPNNSNSPLGFKSTGAMIAFSHGIPNNAPAILHSTAGGWTPLFEGRSTLAAGLDAIADMEDVLVQNSERVLGVRNARAVLSDPEGALWVRTMLILSAARAGLRTASKLSARTRIPLSEVNEIIQLSRMAKWLTERNSLTVLGRLELKRLKCCRDSDVSLAYPEVELYFPTQLRAL